ncbi:MAG: DUF2652 domain-containing protein [Caldilineales bacterium]
MSNTQRGYLLIADISGYTVYLSQSELEHAQEVLSALLRLLIDHSKPPLAISRTAGDAVISYGLADNFLGGQTFVELIEDTYVAFRRMIDLMVLNNACQCNACANISTLDLKFFVHYGTFAILQLGDHDELVGSDVNLIHRLLKNSVVESTGIRAYTLYSDAAIRQLGLEGFCERLVAHRETYEHLGDADLWIQDMHPVWQANKESLRITIPPDRVALTVSTEIALPPHQVWDFLAQPEYRSVIIGSDRQVILNRTQGRIQEGTQFQCYHGDRIIMQTVLQWRPFEQMTTRDLVPIPGSYITVLMDLALAPTDTGTRLTDIWEYPEGTLLGRSMARLMIGNMRKQVQTNLDHFRHLVERDAAPMPAGKLSRSFS